MICQCPLFLCPQLLLFVFRNKKVASTFSKNGCLRIRVLCAPTRQEKIQLKIKLCQRVFHSPHYPGACPFPFHSHGNRLSTSTSTSTHTHETKQNTTKPRQKTYSGMTLLSSSKPPLIFSRRFCSEMIWATRRVGSTTSLGAGGAVGILRVWRPWYLRGAEV